MVDSVIEPICKISHRRLHPASHVADVLQCNHLIRASSNCMAVCKNYDTGYISLLESFKPANAAKPASWQAKGQLVMLQKAWFKSEHFWLVGAWWALRHCYLQSINQMTWKAGSVKRPSADANEDKELKKWRKVKSFSGSGKSLKCTRLIWLFAKTHVFRNTLLNCELFL